MHKRETREGIQVLTPDGRQLGTIKDPVSRGVVVQGPGAPSPVVPQPKTLGTGQDLARNRTDSDAIAGVQAMQFRKGEKSSPDAPPEKPHRSSSTSLAIFLALVGLMALIILALIM